MLRGSLCGPTSCYFCLLGVMWCLCLTARAVLASAESFLETRQDLAYLSIGRIVNTTRTHVHTPRLAATTVKNLGFRLAT